MSNSSIWPIGEQILHTDPSHTWLRVSLWSQAECTVKCYHSGSVWTYEQWQWRGTPHSPKLQHYWRLTIRLFNVNTGNSLGKSYPSAEMQSVYSAAPADWAEKGKRRKKRKEEEKKEKKMRFDEISVLPRSCLVFSRFFLLFPLFLSFRFDGVCFQYFPAPKILVFSSRTDAF